MKNYTLIMTWHYTYDKESTWFDEDSGEERYPITEGASYALPHIRNKNLEIHGVTFDGENVKAEVWADHHTVTVTSNGEAVTVHASDDYSVAGDSVHQSLSMTLLIEPC